MIYLILLAFAKYQSYFRALTYLSSRAILALLTSIVLSTFLYPPIIAFLRRLKVGQPIRELGPASHMDKKGTPTMGGVVILFTTLVSSFFWMDITNHYFITLTLVMMCYGGVGFYDDFLKVQKKNSKGLSSRKKMVGLLLSGSIILALEFFFSGSVNQIVHLPFFKDTVLNLGLFYPLFALLVLVGTSNAVNLTDGLDGLVIGPIMTCSMAFLVLSYVTGNTVISKYLYYHYIPGTGEITVFLSALIGSSIGFLWYNTWPAQVFMGDCGALGIGGLLGWIAILTGHEVLLILIGGVFVVEAISVMAQVSYFKFTGGKRILLMAPLHHHYEKKGWPEQKITIRMWIVSFMLALAGILTLKLR